MTTIRLCAALVFFATAAAAQPPDRPPRDVGGPGRASVADVVISGLVTDAESGAPIRRAEVVALNPVRMDPRTVLTDDAGYFEIAGLEAGRWLISASKIGYWTQQLGQLEQTRARATSFLLADAERRTLDLRLIQR